MTRIERRAVVIEVHPHHRRSRQLPQKPAEEKFALGSLAFDLGDDDVRRRFPDSVERLLLLIQQTTCHTICCRIADFSYRTFSRNSVSIIDFPNPWKIISLFS
jgi:hypothetical protein